MRHRLVLLTLLTFAFSACTARQAPPGEIDPFEKDLFCVDEWSLVHFASGFLLGEILGEDRFGETVALLFAYEVFEPLFWPFLDPTWLGETRVNQTCDIIVGALGWDAAVSGHR